MLFLINWGVNSDNKYSASAFVLEMHQGTLSELTGDAREKASQDAVAQSNR
ncbi:hypothetical protein H4F33_07950 [Pectobacterium brasiliense]|uniref:Uncharacterized protein n=1 Tax=Pectobacterium brasiliense TaxID=180957 RepID=A0AAE3BEL9_9GAMM|nr:hypothetical protein [Pectobacterium brasiliense]MBA0218219.1 hypothetical protein [Pectobacterium brasiliense]MBN3051952.1 hypothetical protein [Pectobacterium brasiliense]MBN3072040.1 hypothetical protein [Pectobacterium brasiliense]MBN3168896.1 hypothetical protein [Pectobacterium brasiliense]